MIIETEFHDPVDAGDGITVYELDDTYHGMLALKSAMTRMGRCRNWTDSDFHNWMNLLCHHRLTSRLPHDPYLIGAYLDWLDYGRCGFRKYAAFRDGELFAVKFFDEDCFMSVGMNRVDILGGFHVTDKMLHNAYGGTLEELALSEDPRARMAAAAATTWHGDMLCSGDYLNVAHRLAYDPDWRVRRAVAGNGIANDRGLLKVLARDPDWRVRIVAYDAAWREGIGFMIGDACLDEDDDVRIFAHALMNNHVFGVAPWESVHDRNPVVRALHALQCPVGMMDDILEDPCDDVQMYLIANPCVGPDEIQAISERSRSEQVRAEALMWLASYEPPADKVKW